MMVDIFIAAATTAMTADREAAEALVESRARAEGRRNNLRVSANQLYKRAKRVHNKIWLKPSRNVDLYALTEE